jgi:hypothetical protein
MVGSKPYPQILDKAEKASQGKTRILQTFVNYGRKIIITFYPSVNVLKLFSSTVGHNKLVCLKGASYGVTFEG